MKLSIRRHGRFQRSRDCDAVSCDCNDWQRILHGFLLLSATPVLHNEREFLAMLHLLSPEMYGLDDLEKLQVNVQTRQEMWPKPGPSRARSITRYGSICRKC